MIEGVLLEARRLQGGQSALARWRARRAGALVFQRLAEKDADRRRAPRRVARLKWGKALDGDDRFLCDCLIADRAEAGARLKLARNIALPASFQLFDEESGAIYAGRVVWRRGVEIGCRLSPAATPGKARAARRMKSRYYAL
ncbi:hypothetical protein [Methylocystis sp. S23]|jgi:hypothetical protein